MDNREFGMTLDVKRLELANALKNLGLNLIGRKLANAQTPLPLRSLLFELDEVKGL